MKIVAVESVAFAREACAGLGEVVVVPARGLTPQIVRDADILLTRSGSRVDKTLLENSRVKFVGTATIGTDHVDLNYLKQRGIGFAAAPGCNSNSVAEYIVSALLVLACKYDIDLSEKSLGVVGIGNVGAKVVSKARALGLNVLENDPPLQLQTGDKRFVPIEKILDCDFITFHVPLTDTGEFATRHMLDSALLSKAKEGCFIFNTSRGGIMDTGAVVAALDSSKIAGAVIDVWENEPNISVELLEKADIGTPHIAGYSFDGKVNGTKMIYDAACRHFGLEPRWRPQEIMPAAAVPEIRAGESASVEAKRLLQIVEKVYDVRDDDEKLREIIALPEHKRGDYFDNLRRDYPIRREFQNTKVLISEGDELAAKLSGIGFKLSEK